MWQEQMARDINDWCGPPFLPKGFVRAGVTNFGGGEATLYIHIGDRVVEFDLDGRAVGSGVTVGIGRGWVIKKLKA